MKLLILFLPVIVLSGCRNPFTPAVDFSDNQNISIIFDQRNLEGVFKSFQYAYSIKDTTTYGRVIGDNFLFTYRDYEQGFDVSWSRDEEMKTTYGLFQNAQRLDLIWNNIVLSTEDSLSANIVRGFNLTITFNPTDVIRVDGRVNMLLSKNPETKIWRISKWIDESNF